MEPIQILIVADDPLVRSGLAGLLTVLPHCEIVGQYNSQTLLLDLVEDDMEEVQVVVWDVGWDMPELLPEWQDIEMPIVVLLPEIEDTAGVWASGVAGILSREVDADSLFTAVQAVKQGLYVFDKTMGYPVMTNSRRLMDVDTAVEQLTERENEVLQLVAEGLTNKAIARQLHISDHTVKFHINAIMTKLDAQSRTEAVVRATRLGIILL